MWLISKRALREFWRRHSNAEKPLRTWSQIVEGASWTGWADLQRTFPSADRVGRLTVFNIGGNAYRLIARVDYRSHRVYVRAVLTHDDYDKDEWKKDAWF